MIKLMSLPCERLQIRLKIMTNIVRNELDEWITNVLEPASKNSSNNNIHILDEMNNDTSNIKSNPIKT